MLWDEPKIFFLERRYFFSIILSEFLKNRVALQRDFLLFAYRKCAIIVPEYAAAGGNGGRKSYGKRAAFACFDGERGRTLGQDACDILLLREIAPFVLQNYTSAGRVSLKTAPVPLSHLHLPEKRRTEIRDTVATLRLDSVVSSAFGISRSRAADLIRAGKVEVNWRVCEKVDRLCAQGDTFSARGFGKCRLREVGGLSKKGRVTICLERYQ